MPDASPSARAWQIEPYHPGDEREILELFNREFGAQRSLEHWQWKFARNPYGGPFLALAWTRDSHRLAGNQVLMPFPMNVRGERVLAGHSLDLVVHPDFRRQGVFEHTAKHAIAQLADAGGKAVVAFPNASSYPGFVRTLGWHRILVPTYWTLRLSMERKLRRSFRTGVASSLLDAPFRAWHRSQLNARLVRSRNAAPDVEAQVQDQVPPGHDTLWNEVRTESPLSLWKDAAYLRWRYELNPDHRFAFHTLRRGADLVALAVTVIRDGTVTVCELLVRGSDPALARRLVGELSAHHAAAGASEIHFLGHDGGMFQSAFEGFDQRQAAENVFVGAAIQDERLHALMADSGNWTVTYGDADFV